MNLKFAFNQLIKDLSLGKNSLGLNPLSSLSHRTFTFCFYIVLFPILASGLVGCDYLSRADENPKPVIQSRILLASQEQTKALPIDLDETGSIADQSIDPDGFDSSCGSNCDDIDAVVIDDDIDEAAVLDDEIENSNVSASDNTSANSNLNLTPEHVPLNAISPETIETFVEVIDVIRHDYIVPVNDEVLFQHSISGMVEKLDSHGEYLTPENYERLRSFTDGEIGHVGINAEYDKIGDAWIISQVSPQSSAKQMGIVEGDKLLKIKKVELNEELSLQDVQQLLSGIAGSQVKVTVENKAGFKRTLMLQRNLESNNQLSLKVVDGIAIIRLPVFQNGSKDQIIKALQDSGQSISGVVIDIRNNPGGVLSSAIDVASLFVADGDLIQVKNRSNSSQIIKSNGTPYLADVPVVVLQNRYSASAAEVLASSIKNSKKALVVGESSFGKGTVQEVIPLKTGGAVKITVAEYRSANGELIDGIGILPDMTFQHDGSDWQQKAVALIRQQDRSIGIKFDNESNNMSIINDY